jgi:hypothetical protein
MDRVRPVEASLEGEKSWLKECSTAQIGLEGDAARLSIEGPRDPKEGRRRSCKVDLLSSKEGVDGPRGFLRSAEDSVAQESIKASREIGGRRWSESWIEARISANSGDPLTPKKLPVELWQVGAATSAVEETDRFAADATLCGELPRCCGCKKGIIRH